MIGILELRCWRRWVGLGCRCWRVMFLDGNWDLQALQAAHSAVSGLDVHGASRW